MAGTRSFKFLTRNGIADAGQDEALAELVAALGASDRKILLHLHGGLIDEKAGLAIADRLSGNGENSWNLGEDWTQVYVIWRTGALETIRTNWTELSHDDRLYQTLVRKLIGFVARKLDLPTMEGRSAANVYTLNEAEVQRRLLGLGDRRDPFGDVDRHLEAGAAAGRAILTPLQSDAGLAIEFQDELAADDGFQAAIGDLDGVANRGVPGRAALPAADEQRAGASLDRLDPNIQSELAPGINAQERRGVISAGIVVLKHVTKIALRCFSRFRSGRDHGLHATIVEEVCRELYADLIGAKIWGMMVQDAADHFAPGAFGRALCDGVQAGIQARLVVTAHSAGSIWAARLLQALSANGISASLDLFLLAPAVRQSLFAETFRTAESLIRQCQMLAMDDAHERRDAVLGHDQGYIYPSSLLYLVSGLFEARGSDGYPDAPLLGMQRFAVKPWMSDEEAANAAAIAAFFQRPGNSIVYGPQASVSMSTSHGGFDDDPTTLKSIAAALKGQA